MINNCLQPKILLMLGDRQNITEVRNLSCNVSIHLILRLYITPPALEHYHVLCNLLPLTPPKIFLISKQNIYGTFPKKSFYLKDCSFNPSFINIFIINRYSILSKMLSVWIDMINLSFFLLYGILC